MHRNEILAWLATHPRCVHGDTGRLLDCCENEARRHAEEDAWLRAKAIIEKQRRIWESSWGFHASEAFVAREVCHELAERMRSLEPVVPEGGEEQIAGDSVMSAFEPEARRILCRWIHDLTCEEEHRIWEKIVRFTNGRGRSLEREGEVSRELSWEGTHSYAETAARVAGILARECEMRAHLHG